MAASALAGWFKEKAALVVIRSRMKHSSFWIHRRFILVRYRTFKGTVLTRTQRLSPVLGAGDRAAEGIMNKICQSEAVLVLALVGLMSCEHEQRPVGNVNLAHVV